MTSLEVQRFRYAAQRERVPITGQVAQVQEEHPVSLQLAIGEREHAAHLGDVGIGSEELKMTNAERPHRRPARDHERGDGHEGAVRRTKRANEEVVSDGELVFVQMLPPGDAPVPGEEGQTHPARRLEVAPFAFEAQQGLERFDLLYGKRRHESPKRK